MPAALRASSSSSANGLEGAHVNFLLNVGHSLHGQCQALSTKCLARAFEVRVVAPMLDHQRIVTLRHRYGAPVSVEMTHTVTGSAEALFPGQRLLNGS